MDFALSTEQSAFAERFGALCAERIAPSAQLVDRTGVVPEDVWRAVVESGYLRLFHPSDLGGLDADGVTLGIALETLAKACGSTCWAASVSAVLVGKMLAVFGSKAHHTKWLAPILRGEKIACYGAVERSSGSELAPPTTVLRRTEGGYLLSGEKLRVSNAGVADVAVIRASRLDVSGPGSGTGSGEVNVVVDLRQKGVTVEPFDTMGLRGTSIGVVKFDEVMVDEGDILSMSSRELTLRVVEWGQMLMTFSSLGYAQAALERSVEFASKRTAFGRPIAHLPAIHGHLSEMKAEIDAARLLAMHSAYVKGKGETAGSMIMMAKIFSTEMAVRVIDRAMRLHGAWGYTSDCGLERLYRDSLGNISAGIATDRLRELVICPLVDQNPWVYEPFDWPVVSPSPLLDEGQRQR